LIFDVSTALYMLDASTVIWVSVTAEHFN